jgi:hypothetical protein
MSVDVKGALLSCREKGTLTKSDEAHIERWLAAQKDLVWQKIVDEIDAAGEIPPIKGGTIYFVVWSALRARKAAETAEFEGLEVKKRKRLQFEMKRKELQKAATDIENVIAFLRNCEFFKYPPSARGVETERKKGLRETCAWLEDAAKKLRNIATAAHKEPRSAYGLEGFVPVVVSRQTRRKGSRTREIGVFMKTMVNFMYSWIGKPRYEFVAKLTNVAFPSADIGAEEVRQNCRRARTGTGTLTR